MRLSTRYLGLDLKNPVVASSSPLTSDTESILRLADAGVAAVVMSSVYEEEITAQELHEATLLRMGEDSQPEASGYFPEMSPGTPLDERLEVLHQASERAGIPVIASLNGCTETGWVRFAARMEQAGAAALEINLWHIPADPAETADDVEKIYLRTLESVKSTVSIPVSMKLVPFFTAPGNIARRLKEAGADGLVLFNRLYSPAIDSEKLSANDQLNLSNPDELRLRLLWTALLSDKIPVDIAVSGGIWSAEDIVSSLLAGARATMVASCLLKNGPEYISVLLQGLQDWMERSEHENIDSFRGQLAAHGTAVNAEEFLRRHYRTMLTSPYNFQGAQ